MVLHNPRPYLNTHSFTVEECVRLINVLIIKFDCECSLHFERGLPKIYISARSIRKLYKQLEPHMCTFMLYKLTGKK